MILCMWDSSRFVGRGLYNTQPARPISTLSSRRVLPSLAAANITQSRCDWLAGRSVLLRKGKKDYALLRRG